MSEQEIEITRRVEEICAFEGRLAGSDAERRLANSIAAELEAQGREVEVEPIWVQPQWAVVHLLHCLLAIAGSLLAPVTPAIGFAIVLVAATSAYLDLTARRYLIRRLLFRRASQNLYARPPGPQGDDLESSRVILCANVDAPRTGGAYNRQPIGLLNRAARRFPAASSPTRIWFWSIALLLVPTGIRMAGVDAIWLDLVQLIPTLVLIVACFLLGEIALSPASPGANANASGVAAVLRAAAALDREAPENLRVEIVLCGAGETTMEGVRSFIRTHRRELDRRNTRFISFESVGYGGVRFTTSSGPAVSLPLDRRLGELCAAVAHASGDDRSEPKPIGDGRTSGAFVARSYGYGSAAITCREDGNALPAGHHTPADLPEALDPAAIERAAGFAVELVRLLDRDLGREISSPERGEPAATSAG